MAVLAYFVQKKLNGEERRRYVEWPGRRKYRGMYKNRRLAGRYPTTWTDDREKAWRFRYPSEAKAQLPKGGTPAKTVAMLQFEKVEGKVGFAQKWASEEGKAS